MVALPPSTWEANRQTGPRPKLDAPNAPRKMPLPAPVKPPEPEELPKGQVVDVAPGNQERPEDARFLAEKDNKTEKQTRAKETTAFYKNAMPRKTTTVPASETTGADAAAKKQESGNDGLGKDDRAKAEGKKVARFEVPSVEKRDAVAALEQSPDGQLRNRSETEAVKGNADRLRILPGESGDPSEGDAASEGRLGQRNVVNLMPSAATLDRIVGAAANDRLDDVEQGDGTFLNTREFKYAGFFNRVKQRVGENWQPNVLLQRRDPEGKVYAFKDRYTVLNVALGPDGRLLRVTVDKSCGVEFLDTEAVAAFERAAPFSNPPPGLVGRDGQVHFTFGFFVEVTGGSPFRVQRARD